MKKISELLDKHSLKIVLVLLVAIFLNTCGNPNKVTNKRLDALTTEVDSLTNELKNHPTYEELEKSLRIEGLKAEKRMIQATDRTMLDVQRQTVIDKEIQELEGK